ncbi:MAG: PDZ domain-containing protein [Phycisphaerae bacterium]
MKRITMLAVAVALSGWLGATWAQDGTVQFKVGEGGTTNGVVVVTTQAAPGAAGKSLTVRPEMMNAGAQEKLINEMQELAKAGKWDELRDKVKELVVRTRGSGPGRQQNPFMMNFGGELKMIKAAYIGVSVSTATPALRSQLKITEGMGLVVDRIDKESPAAAAEVQEHDVITKFDDQLLVNPQQFKVLVRSHKPGDQVK